MNRLITLLAGLFVALTAAFHVFGFLLEVFPELFPDRHNSMIMDLNPGFTDEIEVQSRILENLFDNIGFYNLFIAIGNVAGLVLAISGKRAEGTALIWYSCLFAIGAGVVLMFTTTAYVVGLVQAGLPAIALILMYRASGNRLAG